MIPIVFTGLIVLLCLYIYINRMRNLPPGPWNLPVLGYLLWIDRKKPYETLTELSKKYGRVYGLYLGGVYTVVVSDVKKLRAIFSKSEANGRAPLYLTHGIMKGYGLICAEGELWKDQRRFVHTTLRSLGCSRTGPNRESMGNLISKHVQELVKFIDSQDGAAFDPLEALRHHLGSAINTIVFGKCWSKDDSTWKWLQHLQEEGTKHIGVAGPLNFLPFLRFLPKFRSTVSFLLEGKLETHRLYKKIVEDASKTDGKHFINAFCSERAAKGVGNEFYNETQFYHLLADIFGASLDTTLTTLRWFLLYLAVNQQVQCELRKHVLEVVDCKWATVDDLIDLPFMEATIAEVQRIRSVVPLGIPHGTLKPIQIDNYTIPKGTMVVPLQWAIHMDPHFWENPQRFNPHRFINDQGKFFKPEAFIPFQIGKRMCVGDELGRMFLFLFGCGIVQHFQIECSEEIVDLDGDCGITLTPKPHKLIFSSVKQK